MNPNRWRPAHWPHPSVLIIAAGILITTASWCDFVILARTLELFGNHDGLSGELTEYYRRGQWVVAIALIASGLGGWFLSAAGRNVANLFFHSPEKRFLAAVFLINLTCGLAVQFRLFDNIPHVTDSISHDFQARLMAEGRMFAPRPPCHEAFFQHHVIMTTDGKWFSKYTPGHPLLLAAGYAVNAPFLPVALCHAATPIFLFLLAARFYDKRTARLSALLYTLSPMANLLAGSYMSHTTFLCLALAGSVSLIRLADRLTDSSVSERFYRGALAGFLWGWCVITRPQDAVIAALMVSVACLLHGVTPVMRLVRCTVYSIPGLVIPAGLYLYANLQQYGVPLTIGYGFTQDNVINRVYQASFGLSDQFTLRDALTLAANTLYRFDRAALGWLTTLPLCLITLFRHHLDRRDLALCAAAAIHAGVYFFYDYYGLEFEARYYFNLLPLVLMLLARGMTPSEGLRVHSSSAWPAWLFAMTCHSLLVFWPLVILKHYGPDYEQSSTSLSHDAREAGLVNAVVLIDSSGNEGFRFSSGMIANDPLLSGNIVYARELGDETTRCLQANFPGRSFYRAQRRDNGEGFAFIPVP